MKHILFLFFTVIITVSVSASEYFVDFDSGDDSNSGTSQEEAWKHAPGDINAEAVPAEIELAPGDIIYFKGGVVYRGNITLHYSGDSLNHIIYKGDGWGNGKAIIDGSNPLSNWTALNDSIFYADIPVEFTMGESPALLNPHEFNYSTNEDEFMWISQTPNPADWFFSDDHDGFLTVKNHNITHTSITDSAIFIQSDSTYWNNSSLLIWTNPNRVVERKITGFSPELRTVYFDSLHNEAIYPDERDQSYAIYNSVHALDVPGEYYTNFEEGRIYIYPNNPDSINSSVSITLRTFGINTYTANCITIEGFTIRKHSGGGLRDGIGIGCYTSAQSEKNNYIIRNNYITHNRHKDRGYGGIYLSKVNHSFVENNELADNFQHRGIFCGSGKNVIVRGNTIRRSGSTSLTFYTMRNSQILYNSVFESKGGHANGITLYIASNDILVAGNKVIDCASPITFQDGGNFYFINNLVDSKNNNYGVNEWGRTSHGPWDYGEVVFLNNTLMSVPGQSALNIGNSEDTIFAENDTVYPNTYFCYNNIIDAGGGAENIQRDFNIYTSLAWNQAERYDWYLAENENVNEDRSLIFMAPEETDFRLCENSPAIAAGNDISSLLPVDKFHDFDFYTDINKYPRPQNEAWSIGAYEYGSEEYSTVENGEYIKVTESNIVYPNPTQGEVNIQIDDNIQVEVISVNGCILLQTNENTINLGDFVSGLYLLKVRTEKGNSFIEKVIKY